MRCGATKHCSEIYFRDKWSREVNDLSLKYGSWISSTLTLRAWIPHRVCRWDDWHFRTTSRLEGRTSSRWPYSLSSRGTRSTAARPQRTPSHVWVPTDKYNGIVGARRQPLSLSVHDRVQPDLRGHFIRYVEKHLESRIHASHNAAGLASSCTCLQVCYDNRYIYSHDETIGGDDNTAPTNTVTTVTAHVRMTL